MVYKVVEFDGVPRIKLSEEPGKTLIPGAKVVLRGVNTADKPLFDLLCLRDEVDKFLSGQGNNEPFFDYKQFGEEHKMPDLAGFKRRTTLLFDQGKIVANAGPLTARKEACMKEVNEDFGGLALLDNETPAHQVLLSSACFAQMDKMVKDLSISN